MSNDAAEEGRKAPESRLSFRGQAEETLPRADGLVCATGATIRRGRSCRWAGKRRLLLGSATSATLDTRVAVTPARRLRSVNSGRARDAISSPQSTCAATLG